MICRSLKLRIDTYLIIDCLIYSSINYLSGNLSFNYRNYFTIGRWGTKRGKLLKELLNNKISNNYHNVYIKQIPRVQWCRQLCSAKHIFFFTFHIQYYTYLGTYSNNRQLKGTVCELNKYHKFPQAHGPGIWILFKFWLWIRKELSNLSFIHGWELKKNPGSWSITSAKHEIDFFLIWHAVSLANAFFCFRRSF